MKHGVLLSYTAVRYFLKKAQYFRRFLVYLCTHIWTGMAYTRAPGTATCMHEYSQVKIKNNQISHCHNEDTPNFLTNLFWFPSENFSMVFFAEES